MGKIQTTTSRDDRRVQTKPVSIKPNLRNQQRAEVSADITIELQNGDTLSCTTVNLSRSGVMISCDEETLKLLVPEQRTPAPGHWIPIRTRFSVPVVAQQPVLIVADANIVHMRRIARNDFHLGIQFVEFEGNGYNYVDLYVRKLLGNSLNP